MNMPRQIVHVTAYYPPHLGGVERMVEGTARELSQRGREVTIVTTGPYRSERREEGAPRIMRLRSFEFAHTPFAPLLIFTLLSFSKNSLFHLHLAQAYWPECVRLAAWIRGIPYVVHFHLDVAPSGFFGSLFSLYKRITWGPTLRGASAVIACSVAQKNLVHLKYGVPLSHIEVVPNAVEAMFFTGNEIKTLHSPIRLLSIGRLVPQKRVEILIRALTYLFIPAELTIAGSGEDEERLRALARDLGVGVTFVGRKNDVEMSQLHRFHDLFLISSEHEGGTPLTVLEAMAGGMPIIAAAVKGLRELVENTGVLVNERYAENFARSIEALVKEPTRVRELSLQSIKKSREFTWQRYTDRLEELYTQI